MHQNESPQEVTSFRRKNSGLSRKPLLTKSNTFSSRRADLRTKAPGVDQDAQENAHLLQNSVRRLCQVKSLSPVSRRTSEAPGQLETTSKLEDPVRLVGDCKDGIMAQADSNARTVDTTSRALEDDANASVLEPSDAGSDDSRRVSEIATDAGPDTMSDFSDADEFRSVTSEPISRFSSLGKRSSLRSESSKMSLLSAQSGLSFFTAGSWGSDNSRSLDNLLASVEGNDAERGDVIEDIFPEFPEGSNFLVGDTDASELSFLDAGHADPEVIVNGKNHGVKADRFNAMDSPMGRDYVNYNRGSETNVAENSVGSGRVSIGDMASDQEKKLTGVNMADADAAEKELESEDAEFKALGRINDEVLRKIEVGPGTKAIGSKRSSSGDIAKEDYVVNDVLKDDFQPREFNSAGNLTETASDMENSNVDGWGVDTPTQSESCSHEDGTSSLRYSGSHSSHAEPTPEATENESEVHSGLPESDASLESGSPAFDFRDYSGAKKLEFEPVEIRQLAPLPHAEHHVEDRDVDGSNFQNPDKGPAIRVPETHSVAHNEPLPQPHLDISSVTPVSATHTDSNLINTVGDQTASELGRSGCPAGERVGYNVKSSDEQCASTCEPVHDYNKVSDVEPLSW